LDAEKGDGRYRGCREANTVLVCSEADICGKKAGDWKRRVAKAISERQVGVIRMRQMSA
jgi:hypothetical protein